MAIKHNFKDLTGKKFGRLLIVSRAPNNKWGSAKWNCLCDCGKTHIVETGKLNTGSTVSCGCALTEWNKGNKTVHGAKSENGGVLKRTYASWMAAKNRCSWQKHKAYPRYGGRGISMYVEWRDSFNAFLLDMGVRPENRSLDRINNNGNYEPGNCRWATHSEQQRNRGGYEL